jgi:hypothetical protein
VNKDEYQKIFDIALENASINAEKAFNLDVPRRFHVEVRGGGMSYRILPAENVVDAIYIDENQFWLLINVMVIEVMPDANLTIVSLTITGHGPGTFEQTFSYSDGKGPFHQVLPLELKLSRYIPLDKAPNDFIT